MAVHKTTPAAPADTHEGRFYSYREEEPDLALHLKVVPWDDNRANWQHSHDFVELVYVSLGSGVHVHDDRRYPVYAGDCFVVLPYEQHGLASDRNLSVVNIIFYPELFEPERADLSGLAGFRQLFSLEPLFRSETGFRHKLHLGVAQQKRFGALLAELQQELAADLPGRAIAARAAFMRLVVFLSRCYGDVLAAGGLMPQFNRKQDAVAEAISYLEQHHATDVRVDQVAASVFLSPSRLQHLFKQTTGTSLLDYLAKLRVDRAIDMLRSGGRGLSEIALELGFHDPSYFGRLFRKLTGVTPGAYRRQAATHAAGKGAAA